MQSREDGGAIVGRSMVGAGEGSKEGRVAFSVRIGEDGRLKCEEVMARGGGGSLERWKLQSRRQGFGAEVDNKSGEVKGRNQPKKQRRSHFG